MNALRAACVGTMLAAAGCPSAPPTNEPPDNPVPRETACGVYAVACVPLAGASPTALAPADMNGDGVLDLVVANFGSDNVGVLLNAGDATFTQADKAAVGDSPISLAWGDWDADGTIDVASTGGLDVTILHNRGDGTFTAPQTQTMTLEDVPAALAAADWDGDGDLDIAVATVLDSVTILQNVGGTFVVGPRLSLTGTFTQLVHIAAADFNGDQRPDLVVTHRFTGIISVVLNVGGAFAEPLVIELDPNHVLNTTTPADVDGDGVIDLLVADYGDPFSPTDPGTLWVVRNGSDGTFAAPAPLAAGRKPISIAAADVNGDGAIDLVVANSASDDVSVLLNAGGGVFGTPQSYGVGGGPAHVLAEDLNGDGTPDVAVANFTSSTISVLLNDGGGAFVPAD